MNNNLIIAGCNFIGLYAAIKCLDNGYNVTIIEKHNSFNDKKIIIEFLTRITFFILIY